MQVKNGKLVKLLPPNVNVRLKCTKFDFRWGSAQTLLGAYIASSDPLAAFMGPILLMGGEGKGREGQGRKGKEREGKERGRGRGGNGR